MRKTAFALVALLALVGSSASAQSDAEPATATITIPTLISIDITNANVSFPSPDLDDYTTPGWVAPTSGTTVVSTRANILHRVTIAADAASMTGGAGTKPASHLTWSPTGVDGSFVGLTTGGADVVTGLSRGNNATAAEVWYRMSLDAATDEPGTYSLAFTYTALPN